MYEQKNNKFYKMGRLATTDGQEGPKAMTARIEVGAGPSQFRISDLEAIVATGQGKVIYNHDARGDTTELPVAKINVGPGDDQWSLVELTEIAATMKQFDTARFEQTRIEERERLYREAYEAELREHLEAEIRAEIEERARKDVRKQIREQEEARVKPEEEKPEEEKTKAQLVDQAEELGIDKRYVLGKMNKAELARSVEEALHAGTSDSSDGPEGDRDAFGESDEAGEVSQEGAV